MRRSLAIAALVLTGASVSAPADATEMVSMTPAGTLECLIDGGVGIGVGAYRNLSCAYRRPTQPTEKYEGYTGIVTAVSGASKVVVFQVYSPTPDKIADLGGDYDGRGFGPNNSPVLAGGRSGVAVLEPVVNGSTVRLAELNLVLGVGQLHLNYAGVDSHGTRSRRRLPAESSR